MQSAYAAAANPSADPRTEIVELAFRQPSECFLQFIERSCQKAATTNYIEGVVDRKLENMGIDLSEPNLPNEQDSEDLYLLKAARAYIAACQDIYTKTENPEVKPLRFYSWLSQDRAWLFNDAIRQVLTIAYNHPNCKAAAALNL